MNAEDEEVDLSQKHHRERKPLVFKKKDFHAAESLLTTLYANGSSVSVVYNFLAAIFLLFLLRALFDDIFTHGVPFHHLWLIAWNFEKLPSTLFVWCLMFSSTFIPYTVLKYWAHAPLKKVTVANQLPLVVLYLGYLFLFFYFPLRFLYRAQLNCACSFIITCETTRIAMKMHSFVRENVPRGVIKKQSGQAVQCTWAVVYLNTCLSMTLTPSTQLHVKLIHPNRSMIDWRMLPGEGSNWPTARQFVYFIFCPSFIYRDSYPRTQVVHWDRVAVHATHVFVLIEYVNLVFTQAIRPTLLAQHSASLPVSQHVLMLFTFIPAGWICLLCLFYGLLHSWLNMFSELLRFADRSFYANWWSASNMAEYYRNWNLVVHDWLYSYIFRDITLLLGPSKRSSIQVASTCVFFASALVHEYWFGVSLRIFYPVMFLLYFVAGGLFFSVSRFIKNRSIWNTVLYFNLLIGTGMFVAFYGQEWYAREKCAPYEKPIWDALLPRHWSCRPKLS